MRGRCRRCAGPDPASTRRLRPAALGLAIPGVLALTGVDYVDTRNVILA